MPSASWSAERVLNTSMRSTKSAGTAVLRLECYRYIGDGQPDVRNTEGIFTGGHVRDSELPMVVRSNLPSQWEQFDKSALQSGIARILYSSGDRALTRLRIYSGV